MVRSVCDMCRCGRDFGPGVISVHGTEIYGRYWSVVSFNSPIEHNISLPPPKGLWSFYNAFVHSFLWKWNRPTKFIFTIQSKISYVGLQNVTISSCYTESFKFEYSFETQQFTVISVDGGNFVQIPHARWPWCSLNTLIFLNGGKLLSKSACALTWRSVYCSECTNWLSFKIARRGRICTVYWP